MEREAALRDAMSRASKSRGEASQIARVVARALLSDPDESVRLAATEAIGICGRSSDLFALRERTNDPAWHIRASAFSSMATACGQSSIALIRRGLRDHNPIVRRYAAVALYDVAGASAVEELARMLNRESDLRARPGFLFAVASQGDDEGVRELGILSSHPDSHVASSAKRLLDQVRQSKS